MKLPAQEVDTPLKQIEEISSIIGNALVVAPGDAGVRSRSDVLLILDLHAVVRDVAVYLSASPSKFLILRVKQQESKGNKPLAIHPWYVRGFYALASRLWTLVELAWRRPNRRKAGTSPHTSRNR